MRPPVAGDILGHGNPTFVYIDGPVHQMLTESSVDRSVQKKCTFWDSIPISSGSISEGSRVYPLFVRWACPLDYAVSTQSAELTE